MPIDKISSPASAPLRERLEQSRDFIFANNIFYQRNFQGIGSFEAQYVELRRKENRLHPDDVVRMLPRIPSDHPLNGEWRVRANSTRKLLKYLQQTSPGKIVEVGCGSGWLSAQLATLPESEVVGMDVNETELLQAVRVFSHAGSITFCKADVFGPLPFDHLDCIVLAASVQYFPDVHSLIERLLSLLADKGEIHILDSPFYEGSEIPGARGRSETYFQERGFPLMHQHYHHHPWKSLENFHSKILYNPRSLTSKLSQKIATASPFPWLLITR
jgi:ubiquinone/menaquinone biosynthesis C-methylase UbiE